VRDHFETFCARAAASLRDDEGLTGCGLCSRGIAISVRRRVNLNVHALRS
jgi:hypothetical protein